MPCNRREPARRRELRQDDLRAAQHHVGHRHEHRAHVVERRCDEIDVAADTAIGEQLIVAVGLEIEVRDHRTLGQPRRAARVEDRETVAFTGR